MSVFKRHVCAFCGKKYFRLSNNRCPRCDDIDFDNILYCTIENAEQTYRKVTEYHWERYYYDDSFHNLYVPEEYLVKDGIRYTFLIVYDNDLKSAEHRTYHQSISFCRRLLEKAHNNPITQSIDDVADALSNLGSFRELTDEEIKKYRGPCDKWAREKENHYHCSKQELFEKLRDHYTEVEINDAFSRLNIDFKQEALLNVKEHVRTFGGSRQNAKDCLISQKFTPEEVDFAIDNCEIDWRKEAVRSANKYIEHNGEYSFEKMVFQLTWFDFTQEEAEYAAKTLNLPLDKEPKKWKLNDS